MGRILVRWKCFRNHLKILCHTISNRLYVFLMYFGRNVSMYTSPCEYEINCMKFSRNVSMYYTRNVSMYSYMTPDTDCVEMVWSMEHIFWCIHRALLHIHGVLLTYTWGSFDRLTHIPSRLCGVYVIFIGWYRAIYIHQKSHVRTSKEPLKYYIHYTHYL